MNDTTFRDDYIIKRIKIISFIFIVLLIISISVFMKYKTKVEKAILYEDNINILIDTSMDVNKKHIVSISYEGDENVECSLDDIYYESIKTCTYKLTEGNYKVYIKNDTLKINREFDVIDTIAGGFSSSLDNVDTYYLAKGGYKKLDFVFDYPKGFDKTIRYEIDNPDIITMDKNTIKGLNNGEATLIAKLNDGNQKKYKIYVTDIIQPISTNTNKEYLPCKRYSQEEAELLDKILESRVEEAGVGTRGGVVAAARFLTMEFPYQLRYFNENGRLVTHNARPYVDGEGRYYHKGLYLSEDKYKDIVKSTTTGPKIWGCNLYDEFIQKLNMNGFTCSGFVTWAMLNGGFDVGDVGAGDYKQFDDDLSDLGPHHEITDDYVKNGNYKVGDFIGRNGHAALIIGIDDTTVYTAESLPPKLKVYTYGRYNDISGHKSLVHDDNLDYVIEMGDVYPNGDGWYTNMW